MAPGTAGTGLSAKPQLAATFLPALFIAVIGVAIPEMPIVVEGSAVPVHSIAFRASSLK